MYNQPQMLMRIILQVLIVITALFFSPNFTSYTYAQESTPSAIETREEYNQLLQELREVRSENYQNVIRNGNETIDHARANLNWILGIAALLTFIGGVYIYLQNKRLGKADSIIEYLNKHAKTVKEKSKFISEAKDSVEKDLVVFRKQKDAFEENIQTIQNKAESKIDNKTKEFETTLQEKYNELSNTANRISSLGTVADYLSNATPYVPTVSGTSSSILNDYFPPGERKVAEDVAADSYTKKNDPGSLSRALLDALEKNKKGT